MNAFKWNLWLLTSHIYIEHMNAWEENECYRIKRRILNLETWILALMHFQNTRSAWICSMYFRSAFSNSKFTLSRSFLYHWFYSHALIYKTSRNDKQLNSKTEGKQSRTFKELNKYPFCLFSTDRHGYMCRLKWAKLLKEMITKRQAKEIRELLQVELVWMFKQKRSSAASFFLLSTINIKRRRYFFLFNLHSYEIRFIACITSEFDWKHSNHLFSHVCSFIEIQKTVVG